jgi:hypothetical protein
MRSGVYLDSGLKNGRTGGFKIVPARPRVQKNSRRPRVDPYAAEYYRGHRQRASSALMPRPRLEVRCSGNQLF